MSRTKLFIVSLIVLVFIVSFTVFVLRPNPALNGNNPPIGQAPAGGDQVSGAAVSDTTTSLPQQQPPRSYEYHVNLPNALMLVDSQGRRTGKDPITGVFYHEIPGTGYGEVEHSGELAVSGLPDGWYTLYILGGATGSYWVDAYPPQEVTGTIRTNTMDAYMLNFSVMNPRLVFQETVSSTASITSAPPQNLPLPAVP